MEIVFFLSLSLIRPSAYSFSSLSFIQSYDISASSQTSAASPATVCLDTRIICSLSLNLKCDVMLHLHLPCERLDLSEAMEGWEKDLSTACERRDDLSVYICLVPQPRWGIDVVLQSWSEREMEKGDGRRWTREKSQAGPREVGIFTLFLHISCSAEWRLWISSSDQLRCCSASWDTETRRHPAGNGRAWPVKLQQLCSGEAHGRILPVCVCLHLEFKVTNLLLLKASRCAVFCLRRMPANRCLTSSLDNTLFVS